MRRSARTRSKEAVRMQIALDLSGNITMDAPDLPFEELTALAQNADTSELM